MLLSVFGSASVALPLSHSLLLVIDSFSFLFMFTLFVVSGSVLVWAYYYLDTEPHFKVFLSTVFLFLFSIFGLVLSGNLLILFVFWDLLGFSSLFLVFYFRTRSSMAGGLLTGLSNRVGDVLLLFLFGTVALDSNFCSVIIFYAIVLTSMTKSAQLPFSA